MKNEVRVIGGAWRGRKLRFPPGIDGLRPTPDRVRETLFNWLRDIVPGSRCLDLYAGSGALGFEALSRGAREVVFVERDARLVKYLAGILAQFHARGGVVERADAETFLRARGEAFDLVFLDPPFETRRLPALLALLEAERRVRPGGMVYLEAPAAAGLPSLPPGWQLHRSKRAGEVGYHLVQPPRPGDSAPEPAAAAES